MKAELAAKTKKKASVKKKKLQQGDLLYHAVHGLCRIQDVTEGSNKGEVYYSLVPRDRTLMKVRFLLSSTDLEKSGFHGLVSLKEANEILEFLKARDGQRPDETESAEKVQISFAEDTTTWALARDIAASCREKWESRDQRKRQRIERSAKGLIEELSFVFHESKAETADRVKKQLGRRSSLNPAVLAALDTAAKD